MRLPTARFALDDPLEEDDRESKMYDVERQDMD